MVFDFLRSAIFGKRRKVEPRSQSITNRKSYLTFWRFGAVGTGLIPRTHGPFNVYSAQRLDLFARCVRLSRLLVGFRTHFKSLHFHSFIHSLVATLVGSTKLLYAGPD